jgi:cystathionine beta-lyase
MDKNEDSRKGHMPFNQTRLVRGGRAPQVKGGVPVNPPLIRASTVLFEDCAQQRDLRERRATERLFTYGARGTPTAFALEDIVAEMEGGYRTRLFPTGLAAAAMTLLSYLKPGDHVLMADCVYEPVRKLVAQFLHPYGIDADFFASDGSDIEARLRPTTRMIYVECPGSLVYEMCDLPHLSSLAKPRSILIAADNTWGSALHYRPLTLGADISIMAATKYLGGHSDVMMGTVTTNEVAWAPLQERCDAFGIAVSPDDAYLVLRGIRSLAPRLAQHQGSALMVARWLQGRAEVRRVFCPALPDDPGHALWLRDCTGINGLVSFELHARYDRAAAERLADALSLFSIGASWGGFESLVGVADLAHARSVTDWSGHGPILRLHIGLEQVSDLIADLEQGFGALGMS